MYSLTLMYAVLDSYYFINNALNVFLNVGQSYNEPGGYVGQHFGGLQSISYIFLLKDPNL